MTTRFSKIAKDWELTDIEVGFLSAVIIQLRQGETIGAGAKRNPTLGDAVAAVRAAAYDAEVQHDRTLYPPHLERKDALDAAEKLLTSIMIEWSRVRPILQHFAEKKNGTAR